MNNEFRDLAIILVIAMIIVALLSKCIYDHAEPAMCYKVSGMKPCVKFK